MNISIAMATFNGEKYIGDQLASFTGQTVLPRELVVCDDMSNDKTIDILSRFARTAPFKVKIVCNESTLGFVRNFEKAISLCTGDLIFLSDQDDVWFEEKIEYVERAFSFNSSVFVILNDQEIADQNLWSIGQTMYSVFMDKGLNELAIVAGCCTAIRRDFCKLLIPFPMPIIGHDEWIHRVAAALGVKETLPRVLQYHRRHGENASALSIVRSGVSVLPRSVQPTNWRDPSEAWTQHIERQEQLYEEFQKRIVSLEALGLSSKALEFLKSHKNRVRAFEQRIELVKQKKTERFGKIMDLYIAGFYDSFNGWKSAVKDILR